jgi:hypothetical protein
MVETMMHCNEEPSYDVTSRRCIANAEVAEWQTQRTQKPLDDAPSETIPHDSAAMASDEVPTDGESSMLLPRPAAASDPVEVALARALTEASAAGRFDVVAQLARELEARRAARTASNVIPLARHRDDGRF